VQIAPGGIARSVARCPVGISLSPLETADGLLVSAAMRNVSDHKTTEERISKFALIVESSQDAILTKILDGMITCWEGGGPHVPLQRPGGDRPPCVDDHPPGTSARLTRC
jgi:hypothetical protein